MNKKYSKFISIFVFVSLILNVSFSSTHTKVKAETDNKEVAMKEALTPLKTTVSFMNTGAHPDDERSDFLAYLSRELGVETSSIIANRGEGGQNQIGLELGNQLGIIRTNEMIEAAKVTNVATYHLSDKTSDEIYDFGFSKTPEETLEMWGDDVTYERFIREIRRLRPDIIMPAFRDVNTQHGHHRAMTQLTIRAYEGAADETVFPEHFEQGLKPWEIKKMFLPGDKDNIGDLNVDISGKNPIYNMTHAQVGEKSRYLHKSQGMGKERPDDEVVKVNLELIESRTNSSPKDELFHNMPLNFKDWSNLVAEDQKDLKADLLSLQEGLDEVVESFNGNNYETVFNKTANLLKLTNTLHAQVSQNDSKQMQDLAHKLSVKSKQLQHANYVASNLEVDIEMGTKILVQNDKTEARVSIKNNSATDLNDIQANIQTRTGLVAENVEGSFSLTKGEANTLSIPITVADDAAYFDPYDDRAVKLELTYEVEGQSVTVIENTKNTVAVLPEVSVSLNPRSVVVNTAAVQDKIKVSIDIKHYANTSTQATIGLEVPKGWQVENNDQTLTFEEKLETKTLDYTLIPPRDIAEGDFKIKAYAQLDDKRLDLTVQEIDYDHIDDTYYLYPAEIAGVAFELLSDSSLKIGYVDSELDEVAQHLINFGFDITLLDEKALESGDLNQYDTIITGIRAYHKREDLKEHNHRLIEYVKNGGHLVTQHNLPAEWNGLDRSPLPLTVGSPSIKWRVTDENAEVTLTNPDAPIFHYPNKISDKDWDNWIQERGLYFPSEWSDAYQTFVSMKDAVDSEPFTGGILMAEFGEGTHIYTNLVFYRQIQNQVPGGYRLFTNLITPPVKEEVKDNELDVFNGLVDQWELDDEIDEAYRNKVKAARDYFDSLSLKLQEKIKTDETSKNNHQKLVDSEARIKKEDEIKDNQSDKPGEKPVEKPTDENKEPSQKPSGDLPSTGMASSKALVVSSSLIAGLGLAIKMYQKKK